MTAADESRVVWRHEIRDINGPNCDCDCHTDPDMDPASCDHCTGKSEQERARSEPRAYEPLSGLDALRHDIEAEPRAEGLREAVAQAIVAYNGGKRAYWTFPFTIEKARKLAAELLPDDAAMELLARTDRPE